MRFFLLGPLEIVEAGRQLPLGGVKQRLTLALLLLRHNSLVPINDLIGALWPNEAPASARKMMHNAVFSLRKFLAAGSGEEGTEQRPMLLTQAPGYMLRLSAEAIDVVLFQDTVSRGHAALAAGRYEQAASFLREALDLWRGPFLPELAEQSISWPEAGTILNARLTALEDRIEADLHLGRQTEVLGELEVLVDQEPLRERLCAQLMRVLYQRGRQADALTVFRRTRTALVEQLGLDPSPELQELERAILNHDVSLQPATREPRGHAVAGRPDVGTHQPEEPNLLEELRPATVVLVAAQSMPGISLSSAELAALRLHISGILAEEAEPMQARVLAAGETTEEAAGELLDDLATSWHEISGDPQAPVWLVTSGPHATGELEPWRALQLALSVNARLTAVPGLHAPSGQWLPFQMRLVVVTGEALVVHRDHETAWSRPAEDTVELCLRLLESDAAGPLRMCPTTEAAVRVSDPLEHLTFLGRDHELRTFDRALASARLDQQPHLLTVFGDGGIGRSRLLTEWISRQPSHEATFLVGHAPSVVSDANRAVPLAELVRAAAGIGVADPPQVVIARLTSVIGTLVDARRAPWLLAHLNALLGMDVARSQNSFEAFEAWAQFFEALAVRRPLVLIIDDLHWADPLVLDFLDYLVEYAGNVALLVVGTARPDILLRRPSWGSGKLRATSLAVRPLTVDDTARLLWDACRSMRDTPADDLPGDCPEHLLSLAGELAGNPLYAVEYGKMLGRAPGHGVPPAPPFDAVPYQIHTRREFSLDLLPVGARALIYDAAVCGDVITEARLAVLATGRRQPETGRWLRMVTQRGILRSESVTNARFAHHRRYHFADLQLRQIAQNRLPRATLQHKERLLQAIEKSTAAHTNPADSVIPEAEAEN